MVILVIMAKTQPFNLLEMLPWRNLMILNLIQLKQGFIQGRLIVFKEKNRVIFNN